MKKNYIVMIPNLIDINRAGQAEYGDPRILGVVDVLDEAKLLLKAMGKVAGRIIEVVNPIEVDGRLVPVPPVVHNVEPKRPAKAAPKKAAPKKAAKPADCYAAMRMADGG
jgi:hypothetical protein